MVGAVLAVVFCARVPRAATLGAAMAPAPPGPSKYRVAGTSTVKMTDGVTPALTGVEARAGWVNVEEHGNHEAAAYKQRFDVPPANRKARRAAASKARRA